MGYNLNETGITQIKKEFSKSMSKIKCENMESVGEYMKIGCQNILEGLSGLIDNNQKIQNLIDQFKVED